MASKTVPGAERCFAAHVTDLLGECKKVSTQTTKLAGQLRLQFVAVVQIEPLTT